MLFVIILTVAYVIYYTVVICTDLYRKPRDQKSSSVETFEVPDMPEEVSKAVEETDGGFRVSRGGEDPAWDETDLRTASSVEPEQPEKLHPHPSPNSRGTSPHTNSTLPVPPSLPSTRR